MRVYQQYMYSYPHKTAYYPLDRRKVFDAVRNIQEASLYVHIPFCEDKCGYCNLFSVPLNIHETADGYISALDRQAEAYLSGGIRLTSFTMGGGTPSILDMSDFERLFNLLKNRGRADIADLTSAIELSPGCDREKMRFLAPFFSRFSIGIQSFDDGVLRALKRNYSADMCRAAIVNLIDAGVEYFNADLIYGVPGQNEKSFLSSVDTLISFAVPEIFLYPLYIRPGTGLNGSTASENDMLSFYYAARDKLIGAGYVQRSMRRFTKAQYNLAECGLDDGLALGCGARSYVGNLHFCTKFEVDLNRCRAVIDGFIREDDFFDGLYGYELDTDELKRRYIIKNLFVTEGLCKADYAARFGGDLRTDFASVKKMIEAGYAREQNGRIVLTETGLALSDALAPRLISERVAQAMLKGGYDGTD